MSEPPTSPTRPRWPRGVADRSGAQRRRRDVHAASGGAAPGLFGVAHRRELGAASSTSTSPRIRSSSRRCWNRSGSRRLLLLVGERIRRQDVSDAAV